MTCLAQGELCAHLQHMLRLHARPQDQRHEKDTSLYEGILMVLLARL